MLERSIDALAHVRFSDSNATVTELSATDFGSVAVWGVRPGQEVPAHFHPDGQDTWVVLRGSLTYFVGNGQTREIHAGTVDIADRREVHGARNSGVEDAVFLSIYSARSLKTVKATP